MASSRLSRVARATAAVLLLGASATCGGGGGSDSTGPSSTIPNLVGEYSGVWSQDLSADGVPAGTVECPCTFTVPTQTGGTFYARSQLSAPCNEGMIARGAGGLLSVSDGQVTASGAVTFRFSDDVRATVTAGGCTVPAMPPFTGTATANTISVSRTESYDCRAGGGQQYTLAVRFNARK